MRFLLITQTPQEVSVMTFKTKQRARNEAKTLSDNGAICLIVTAQGLETYQKGVRVAKNWSLLKEDESE